MDNRAYALLGCLFTTQAYARTMPSGAIVSGVAIVLLPPVIGAVIAGKKHRWWFAKTAMLVYVISSAISMLATGQATVIIFLFFPYVLLPMSIYKRYSDRAL